MDNYLNLFFSYDGGSRKDLERKKQLENNLTRAFIITLSNLSTELSKEFLGAFIDQNDISVSDFKFELQSIEDQKTIEKVQKCRKKILLIIESSKSMISKKDLVSENCSAFLIELVKEMDNLGEIMKTKTTKEVRKLISDEWATLSSKGIYIIDNCWSNFAEKVNCDVKEERLSGFSSK
ncbi:MAG: hypothetical protein IPG99_15285 [Ignavibacteria bacterium]|nr:hypothetical protein [Ignavibacteria bacterium]